MTISTDTFPHQYIATSGQTVFAYQSKIFSDDDIRVIVTDTNGAESVKIKGTDYTVSGVGNENGGSVTFTTGVTLNYLVTITRNEPFTQEIDYVKGDDFPAAAHEEGLDRAALRDQFLNNLFARTIRFTEGSNISSITPELTLGEMKDKLLYFDATTGEPMGIDYSDLVAGASSLNITVPTGHITTPRIAEDAVTFDKILSLSGIYIDENGNNIVKFTPSSNAVNYISLTNSATGGAPSITAVGSDPNIQLSFSAKNTPVYNFLGIGAFAAALRYFEAANNGSNYVQVQAPVNLASNYTLVWPAATGTKNQSLQIDGSNNLEFSSHCFAQGRVDGTGSGSLTISNNKNLTSFTKNSTGDYTIVMANAYPNAFYSVQGIARGIAGNNEAVISIKSGTTPTTTTFNITVRNASGVLFDSDDIRITII